MDLLGWDRAVRAAAADPADDRGDHVDRFRDRRAGRRLQRSGDRARDRADGVVVQPIRHLERQHARHRGAGWHLHLLGVGQRRLGQRGVRERLERPGQGGSAEHAAAAADLSAGHDRVAGIRRYSRAAKQRRRHLCVPGPAGLPQADQPAPDHHRVDLGVGVDADHDPADRANVTLNGPLGRRSRRSLAACTQSIRRPTSRRSCSARSRRSCSS